MHASHSSPVLPARILPSAKVRIQIAAGVPPHLARRDRRGVLTLRLAGLAQFRSAAVGAASLIAGCALAGVITLNALLHRVFALHQKGSVSGSVHVLNMDPRAEHDAPQFEAPGV